jgi:hypothetical protein
MLAVGASPFSRRLLGFVRRRVLASSSQDGHPLSLPATVLTVETIRIHQECRPLARAVNIYPAFFLQALIQSRTAAAGMGRAMKYPCPTSHPK